MDAGGAEQDKCAWGRGGREKVREREARVERRKWNRWRKSIGEIEICDLWFCIVCEFGCSLAVSVLRVHFSLTRWLADRRSTWRGWMRRSIGCSTSSAEFLYVSSLIRARIYNGTLRLSFYEIVHKGCCCHNREITSPLQGFLKTFGVGSLFPDWLDCFPLVLTLHDCVGAETVAWTAQAARVLTVGIDLEESPKICAYV